MKNLYYYNWQLQETVFGVVMDDIKERYQQDEIHFVSCKGSLLPCWSNKASDPLKCEICRFNQKSAFSSDFKNVTQIYIDDYCTHDEVNFEFENLKLSTYSSIEEIRKLEYKGVSIGYGALSSYISSTRNLDALIDDDFKKYFNRLLKTEIFIKIAIDRIIKEIRPDVISIFNGRIHDTRPVFQTALQKGITLRGVETVVKGEFDYQRRIFTNALPHNIDFQTESIREVWENSKLTDEKKRQIGSSFYQNRRNNILARAVKVFTLDQQKGLLPDNWNPSKRNIVFFNSSEDEFAAIGEDWDKLALFPSQESGLNFILSEIEDPNFHFYLRIHPNLKDVSYGYHKRLYQLERKFDNITVISPHSPVSTYTLIDNAEKVVVFGSSTGVEANFSQKPVVLLGGTFYYYLNATYNPKSKYEAIDLIKANIKPKSDLGAIQFGFYLMQLDGYSKPIAYNAKPIKIFGKKIGYSFPHLKFSGSSLLHKAVLLGLKTTHYIRRQIRKPDTLVIPKAEQ